MNNFNVIPGLTRNLDKHNRSALVLGAGKSGMAAASLLEREGYFVTIADDSPTLTLPSPDQRERGIRPELLDGKSFVVLSPGIPRAHAVVREALARQIPVLNEIEVAAAFLPACKILGITGTNGKSTTTTMLGCIVKAAYPDAFVGGNLGTPFCEAVLEGQKPSVAVLELSSYQLETISRIELEVAIVTNLAPDHLDRYASVDDYYAAKLGIANLLSPNGTICVPSTLTLPSPASGRGVKRFDSFSVDGFSLNAEYFIGEHNRLNAAAAIVAAQAFGVSREQIQQGLNNYKGIAHRLEPIGEINGVRWINDTKATNVDSAVVAVKSFASGIHLILGGLGKGSSYDPLIEACRGKVAAIYAIGQEAPLIMQLFSPHFKTIHAETLDQAAALANKAAVSGDVILLAPACASFDQFNNFAERGDRFKLLFEKFARENEWPKSHPV